MVAKSAIPWSMRKLIFINYTATYEFNRITCHSPAISFTLKTVTEAQLHCKRNIPPPLSLAINRCCTNLTDECQGHVQDCENLRNRTRQLRVVLHLNNAYIVLEKAYLRMTSFGNKDAIFWLIYTACPNILGMLWLLICPSNGGRYRRLRTK